VASERRSSLRTPFDGWVELRAGGTRRLATGFDLSAGGIGIIVSPDGLPPRTSVTCEFPLRGISLPVELEGRVAWSVGPRVGVCFGPMDPGLVELLENHVAGHL
jgi:hypothetical protein